MEETKDKTSTTAETYKKRPFRILRIIINLILLIGTAIVVVQNAHTVTIDFLWTKIDISLAILIFITGSIGSVITLFFLLFKK